MTVLLVYTIEDRAKAVGLRAVLSANFLVQEAVILPDAGVKVIYNPDNMMRPPIGDENTSLAVTTAGAAAVIVLWGDSPSRQIIDIARRAAEDNKLISIVEHAKNYTREKLDGRNYQEFFIGENQNITRAVINLVAAQLTVLAEPQLGGAQGLNPSSSIGEAARSALPSYRSDFSTTWFTPNWNVILIGLLP